MKIKQPPILNDANNNSKIIHLTIPQMGEGLYEVRVIQLFKNPGDYVKEEEIIYEIETDKTTVQVESANTGKLSQWLAREGDILKIGAFIAELEVTVDCLKENILHNNNRPKILASEPNRKILSNNDSLRAVPPRTRAYCKSHGITVAQMLQIPIAGNKLMPKDVDDYLSKKNHITDKSTKHNYLEIELSAQQQQLIQRFVRSQQNVIPAFMVGVISINDLLEATRKLHNKYFSNASETYVSSFQIFAYCVTQACIHLEKFRSALINNNKIRQYPHLDLGIAVHTDSGELMTAVIPAADTLSFTDFIETIQMNIKLAMQGKDQAKCAPHILLSHMGNTNIVSGSPLLIEPSVATLFLGAPYYAGEGKSNVNLSLTFDHRLINGMDAVNFIQSVNKNIQTYGNNNGQALLEENNGNKHYDTSLQDWLLIQIAELLKTDIKNIDLNESLGLQGLDSIMAVQLSKILSDRFEANISSTVVWHYPTPVSLLQYLYTRFDLQEDNTGVDLDQLAKEFQYLSESELDSLLND